MEIGTEISQKIRGAIKAKLVDLGSYVDDELPDYIMVMVANKKSKQQMTDDLNLFLGANTDIFTSWLHDVLGKLETATVSPSGSTKPTDTAAKTTPEKASAEKASAEKTSAEKTSAEKTSTESKKSKKSKRSKDKSSHHKSSKHKDKDKDRVKDKNKEKDKDKKKRKSSEAEKATVTTVVAEKLVADKPKEAPERAVAIIKTAEKPAEIAVKETAPAAVIETPEPLGDAIILNPDTHDILDEEIKQESKKQDEKAKSSQRRTVLKTTPVSTKTSPTKNTGIDSSHAAVKSPVKSPTSEQMPTKRTVEKTTVTRARSSSAGATLSTITVVPKEPERKRRGPGSVVGQVIQDDDDDDDGPSPGKRVASTVELHRRPSLPISKQANTSLLKKAVTAAQESTKDAVVAAEITRTIPMVVQRTPAPMQKRFKLIRATSASGANKTLLVRAVNEANESTISAVRSPPPTVSAVRSPPPTVSAVRTSPPTKTTIVPASIRSRQQQSQTGLYSRSSKAATEVQRKGLVSRSRLREVAERDFDAQEFMTVETVEEVPQTMQIEEHYEIEEEQEEMEVVDSRHIFVEDHARRGRPITTRAVEVMDQDEGQPGDVMMMVQPSKPVVDQHVVVKKENPIPPRPVSPKFIVTLDGPPPKSGKSKKAKPQTKAAAFIAPRMDITRTIDNSSMTLSNQLQQSQIETEYIQTAVTSYQEEYLPVSEPEYVYVSSQIGSPPQAVFNTTPVTMMADVEHQVVSRQMQLDEPGVILDQQQIESTPGKKQSQSERCRFWPACKNGNDCPFVHPTAPCKTFPNCKFGDKCVFIHPNCKYDARCTKTNCPFTHASKRSPSAPPPRPVLRKPPSRGLSQTVCKFFPNCANIDCPFQHPKPCRFGRSCSRKDCHFTHPQTSSGSRYQQVTTGAALKWTKANKEKHISERGFAVKTAEQQILPN